ncbi:MAG: FAD-dependent oxidoreductase [Steroidobacteraceae bacterium]
MRASRRHLLQGAGAAVAAGVFPAMASAARHRAAHAITAIPIAMDRILGITVCTRPFRAAGPRLEIEKIGRQDVVHHYGHGGSGWSLSWGSAEIAAELALRTGAREIGVIGCGAIGLTTALQLQRMGASQVTIYARETPPEVRSSWATGGWTPDSRICLESGATPEFKQTWQRMARSSWRMFSGLLGLAGDPVGFVEGYSLSDKPPSPGGEEEPPARDDGRPKFARLTRELTPEISFAAATLNPSDTPFVAPYVRRRPRMTFSIGSYSRLLLEDFRMAGGRLVIDDFRTPAEFARLPQQTLVNATGYGARALLGDESIVPVKGQLARLMPAPQAFYGLSYRRVSLTTRHDITVIQAQGVDGNTYEGYNDASTDADPAVTEFAVKTLAAAYRPGAA